MEERIKRIEQHIVDVEEEGDETLQEALYALSIGDGGVNDPPSEEDPSETPPAGALVATDQCRHNPGRSSNSGRNCCY